MAPAGGIRAPLGTCCSVMIKGIEKSLVIWSFWMPFNRMLETISFISSL